MGLSYAGQMPRNTKLPQRFLRSLGRKEIGSEWVLKSMFVALLSLTTRAIFVFSRISATSTGERMPDRMQRITTSWSLGICPVDIRSIPRWFSRVFSNVWDLPRCRCCNRARMHSVLGYLSPAEFEEANWPKENSRSKAA